MPETGEERGVCPQPASSSSAVCPRAACMKLWLHDLEAIAALTYTEKQLWFLDRMSELQTPLTEVQSTSAINFHDK